VLYGITIYKIIRAINTVLTMMAKTIQNFTISITVREIKLGIDSVKTD